MGKAYPGLTLTSRKESERVVAQQLKGRAHFLSIFFLIEDPRFSRPHPRYGNRPADLISAIVLQQEALAAMISEKRIRARKSASSRVLEVFS